MTKPLLTLTLAATAAVALVGCGETKILGKSLPDETQVVDGPSLALPPSFELRPPVTESGTDSPATAQPAAATPAAVPSAESWIVDQASKQGNIKADPNVRTDLTQTVVEEKKTEKTESKGLFKKWFGKKDSD